MKPADTRSAFLTMRYAASKGAIEQMAVVAAHHLGAAVKELSPSLR